MPSQINGSDENLEGAWCVYNFLSERLQSFSYRPLSPGLKDLTQPRWSTEEREAIKEHHYTRQDCAECVCVFLTVSALMSMM